MYLRIQHNNNNKIYFTPIINLCIYCSSFNKSLLKTLGSQLCATQLSESVNVSVIINHFNNA